jgi:transcriptional regulator with XRE-family HTH domain
MQTIGERFEEARKKKGASIREAAESTKIRGDYLQKFEANQFDLDLAPIYVKGFLRAYASYLKLPPERILADFASLGLDEASPRQPSREVYGRMDLSIASADERTESAAAAQPAPQEPGRVSRGRANLPAAPLIEPTLVFRGGIALAVVVLVLLGYWAVKSLVSDSPASPPPIAMAPAATDSVITISALNPVRIKVVRQSDGSALFPSPGGTGSLDRGDRHDFPNVPLFLTSTALESVEILYKGRHYATGQTGYNRVALDFSNVK